MDVSHHDVLYTPQRRLEMDLGGDTAGEGEGGDTWLRVARERKRLCIMRCVASGAYRGRSADSSSELCLVVAQCREQMIRLNGGNGSEEKLHARN